MHKSGCESSRTPEASQLMARGDSGCQLLAQRAFTMRHGHEPNAYNENSAIVPLDLAVDRSLEFDEQTHSQRRSLAHEAGLPSHIDI